MENLSVRLAQPDDFLTLSSFLSTQSHIHRHLDWKSPLDWLGTQPFLIAERAGKCEAVLACPADPPHVAWIRLFACSLNFQQTMFAWNLLFELARQTFSRDQLERVVALGLHPWFEDLLIKNDFRIRQRIIVLDWELELAAPRSLPPDLVIRPMEKRDLPTVYEVDAHTFELIWQNSLDALHLAFEQSAISTVATLQEKVIGYQISTSFPFSGHLARLAVLPQHQRMNIAYGLVHDLLVRFKTKGIWRVSVNTQDNNFASLALYQKIGFRRTGEEFPVYEFPLTDR
jgi:ribosomal protein S18 acetylase RimI-like enzyme